MALTESEKAALNLAFQKMLQVNGLPNGLPRTVVEIIGDEAAEGGGADVGDIVVNPTFATQATLTYYVDSAGSDSNDGSLASPFLTIQKAIDSLPKRIRHPVVVSVGVGNFAGFYIQGFHVESSVTLGSLKILGTVVTATLAGGLTTGTIASATAGTANSATWGTATVTGAGWTVNDLIGKWIRIDAGTGAGQYKCIAFNDATTLTITGNWTAPTGSTFTIVDNGTIINTFGPASGSSAMILSNNVSGGSAQGSGIVINIDTITTTVTRGLFWDSPSSGLYVVRCAFKGNNLGINTVDGSSLTVDDSYFTGQTSTVLTGIPFAGRTLTARRNVFNTSTRGISLSGGAVTVGNVGMQQAYLINNYYRGMTATTGVAVILGPNSYVVTAGERIDALTASSRIGYGTNGAGNINAKLIVAASDISNCSKAIDTLSGGHIILSGVVSGTGNTTAVSATTGSSVLISSTTTLTGTTELSIDGTAFTLAQMRAAVPKIITSVEYGTKVYE